MSPFNRKQTSLLISMLLFFLLACNATFNVGVPTPTILVPAETAVPTYVPLISQQVTLVAVPFNETNPGPTFPSYTITAQIPQLTGSDDPHVRQGNPSLVLPTPSSHR